MAGTITYHGETLRLADRMALMALMRFAKIAQTGVDTEEMEGLAALYDLLEQCIDPARYCAACDTPEGSAEPCCDQRRITDDWSRFQQLSMRHRDQDEQLLEVVKDAVAAMSARPTQRSSVSSDGPPPTSGSSTAGSSSPVALRYERRGRPDLALIVTEAQEALAARAS